MAKRRTRKDKETAQHTFTVSWNPELHNLAVKSQKKDNPASSRTIDPYTKNPSVTAIPFDLASIRQDILRSLATSAFILLFELVIYFFWK